MKISFAVFVAVLIAVFALQSCSSTKVSDAKLFNEYPGLPNGTAVTTVTFRLECPEDSRLGSCITSLNGADTLLLREVYSSTNQVMHLDQVLPAGSYRITARSPFIINYSVDTDFLLMVNNKQVCIKAVRLKDLFKQ